MIQESKINGNNIDHCAQNYWQGFSKRSKNDHLAVTNNIFVITERVAIRQAFLLIELASGYLYRKKATIKCSQKGRK